MISPVTNRVPFSEIISSFDDYYDKDEDLNKRKECPHRPGNLIYNPNFILILNDFVYSFQEISGIDIDFPNDHGMTEGGNSRHLFARKTLMEEDTTNLILKRAMPIRRSQIKAQNISALLSLVTPSGIGFLRKQSLLAAAKLDPVYTLEHGPAEGIIQIFDRTFKNDVANFRFFSYGAHKWTLGELDATSGNIVYETIELICTNFTRVLPRDVRAQDNNIWINFINDVNDARSQEFYDLEAARNKRLQDLKDLETDNAKRKEKWEKDQEQLKKEQEKREKRREKRINEFLTKIREQQKVIQEQLKKDLEKEKAERLEKMEALDKENAKRKEEWEKIHEQLKKDLEKEKNERSKKMENLDKENAKRKEEWKKIHEQLKKEQEEREREREKQKENSEEVEQEENTEENSENNNPEI